VVAGAHSKADKTTTQVLNGYEAEAGEAPFIVSLQSLLNAHYCAGSLITDRVVLTAAHCMTSKEFQVVAGAHSKADKTTTQVRKASSSRQVIHEKYGGGVGPSGKPGQPMVLALAEATASTRSTRNCLMIESH